ncbi:SGNH/GDSL hydrolase family protein [Amycolatopsis sp. PS_44_ISF1]|uniref:SGNH/GDSL hydrolase family protein n=1 Tax=Amycolatopsis sp. PS_44_ISF1 TaxID=2974917 RepID=UPI0028DE65B0|nr:SGNH/GDSL hydrolase family protein [Amycolatopsis sp. PS_44_ISF1]MDT8911956.1 SGNH/GDSL hydrolase family protein [Amycolatopsis sp. PS_44_ISF1]
MKLRAKYAAVTLLLAGLTAGIGTVPSAQADTSGKPAWCTGHANVSILGTSADTGYGTTGYPAGRELPAPTPYGWTTKFTNDLHSEWGTKVDNRAHNGAMASDFLPGGRWSDTTSATADMAGSQPDLVVIDLGGNEFLIQKDPAQFAADFAKVIDNVRAARPDATILLSIYAELKWAKTPSSPATQTHTWSEYAAKIHSTAVDKGVALVDLRQYIPPAASATLPSPSPWLSDNMHLNDAGNLAEYGAYWGWASSIASIC